MSPRALREIALFISCASLLATPALAAERDQDLLDILRENGSITQEQYEILSKDEDSGDAQEAEALPPVLAEGDGGEPEDEALPEGIAEQIGAAVAKKVEEEFPIKASYGSKGFRLETRDGNWQMNLQWRFQFRLTYPTRGDPRQVDDFTAQDETTFEARRLRMKIGGHGYRPWLKYYFEVDLEPTRESSASSSNSSTRLLDWRIDLAKYEALVLRVGQWKVDYNRERNDSSGRQQFVERSIVNRIFTIDRQVGMSLRGHLFKGTSADLRYYAGVFTGEGRGVANDDNYLMYAGRLQWNFLGRDLGIRQTDVERTELPTASLAFAGATHTGVCTRWSSSGCGRLDGFDAIGNNDGDATQGQYRVHQAVQELAFKWQGFSFQQELHWKQVIDRSYRNSNPLHQSNLYGLYAQTGYFFHEICESFPEPLELAFRYAFVREPNKVDRLMKNLRQEFTAGANWFFSGHKNKLTLDYSYLTLDDDYRARNPSEHRVRFQWDVSF